MPVLMKTYLTIAIFFQNELMSRVRSLFENFKLCRGVENCTKDKPGPLCCKSRAIARPRPDDEPLMMATLSSKRGMVFESTQGSGGLPVQYLLKFLTPTGEDS